MQEKGGNSQPMLTFPFSTRESTSKVKERMTFLLTAKGHSMRPRGGFAAYCLGDFGVTLKAFQIGLIFKIGLIPVPSLMKQAYNCVGHTVNVPQI